MMTKRRLRWMLSMLIVFCMVLAATSTVSALSKRDTISKYKGKQTRVTLVGTKATEGTLLVRVKFANGTNRAILVTEEYSLQRKEGSKWVKLPQAPVQMIGFWATKLKAHKALSTTYCITDLYSTDLLKKGKYRIKVTWKAPKRVSRYVTFRVKKEMKGANNFSPKPISENSKDLTASVTPDTYDVMEASDAFCAASADLSLGLLTRMLPLANGKSVIISPHSIATALAMVNCGAAGETQKNLSTLLGGSCTRDEYDRMLATTNQRLADLKHVQYDIADAMWFHEKECNPKRAFLKRIATYYHASLYAAPFDQTTVNDINNWCYNNTQGLIPGILDDLSGQERMVLLNAVYFQGKWAEQYKEGSCRDGETFHAADGTDEKVTMLTGTENRYVSVGGGTGFIKPYEGGETGFLALLPPEGMDVETYLAGITGKDLLKGFKEQKHAMVKTKMPEFKTEFGASLKDALADMGVADLFAGGDLSDMATPDLYVDDVLHKAYIEVDRTGTKAAAVTAAIEKATAAPGEEFVEVYLDRPFVYAIVDMKTGLPLFFGAVKQVNR